MTHGVQAPLTLDQVSKLFSNWRETRPGKGPIPESLLKAVARLHVSHSSRKIAKALRLNQTEMKSKLKKFEAEPNHQADPVKSESAMAHSQGSVQVTKIVAVESLTSNESSSVEIVSPGGWILRSSTGPIKELQILEFARAISGVPA